MNFNWTKGSKLTPIIFNETMTLADTEYSKQLPGVTRAFAIKCRTASDIKLKFAPAGDFITIPAGQTYYDEDCTGPITIYFECPDAAKVAEIVQWQPENS